MDLTVDEFVDGLLNAEAHRQPSDSVKAEDLQMKLPKWFDENKFNQGKRFYRDFYFAISASLIPGLIAVFAVPSILKILIGSRRSSSSYTAYKRYLSTFLHIITWYTDELKPGSMSWISLHTVRTRHIHAGRAAQLKGQGIVSQRDMGLTLFGFIGFLVLKPDSFSVTQMEDGDWEGLNHLIGVCGHMIGLEDRYNVCRGTVEETRQVCKKILSRVFTPCLNNPPEHFEHMSRVMIEGLSAVIPYVESQSFIYWTKQLADVPGYITNEDERYHLQQKIKKHLKGCSPGDVDEYIEGLFSKNASEQPCDEKTPDDLELKTPEWFDEKICNQARRFYWDNCFMLSNSMLLGLVAVFAIPSILRVLVGTRRSNSTFTAYRRYLSTLIHTMSWFEYELKPGSTSWRSLLTVRTRHLKASLSAKLKHQGIVSQRDLALTQFGFIGFAILKPEKFGIRQFEEGDWEAYNHYWRVIGHLIGLEERYNLCRKNIDETRKACKILLERVYTPCLENVPEYFEHMSRSMLEGMSCVNPLIHVDGILYYTKYLAEVPGHVYTEKERIEFQVKCMEQLNGRSHDIGIETSSLMAKPLIDLPNRKPRYLYVRDYDSLDQAPNYKRLPLVAKYKIALYAILAAFYSSYLGRMYLNLNFRFSLLLMKYFPYVAFFKFGVIKSYARIFSEDPVDDTEPKPNSEYEKPQPPLPLYKEWLSFIW